MVYYSQETYSESQIEHEMFGMIGKQDPNFFASYEQLDSVDIYETMTSYFKSMIFNYLPTLMIVFFTRVVHLMIDLVKPNSLLLKNIVTSVLGCYQILNYMDSTGTDNTNLRRNFVVVVVVFHLFLARIITRINPTCSKSISIFVILLPILVNEYYIQALGYHYHTYLRALLMSLTMKLFSQISIYQSRTSFLSLFAYLVHPASTIFGTWHPNFCDYKTRISNRFEYLTNFKEQLICTLRDLIKVICILLLSDWLIEDFAQYVQTSLGITTKFSLIYFEAMQFRFSHYFMCYLTSTLINLWKEPWTKRTELCRISAIENPYSLVQVVVFWNIATHKWLKDYIFIPIKTQTSNTYIPILATYLISSTLHGFKFHIWSVLLSLGALTMIEYTFRMRLARRLNACVLAKKCRYSDARKCLKKHRLTIYNSTLVMTINFCFRLLAIAHLAYLGYIFRINTDDASYIDALNSWKDLYFYSHIIAFLMYSSSMII